MENKKVKTICEHGSLKRQCLICELENEVAQWKYIALENQQTVGDYSTQIALLEIENERLRKIAEHRRLRLKEQYGEAYEEGYDDGYWQS